MGAKRRFKGLHQITTLSTTEIVDEYEPLEEGLDKVTDTRTMSCIEIKLSQEPLDTSDKGYQAPLPDSEITDYDPEKAAAGRGRGRGKGRGKGKSKGKGKGKGKGKSKDKGKGKGKGKGKETKGKGKGKSEPKGKGKGKSKGKGKGKYDSYDSYDQSWYDPPPAKGKGK